MSTFAILFMLLDAVMKLVKPLPVVQATVQLGFPESVIFGLGIALLVCTVLYAIPGTSVLGAILLTGYLGGAVASKVRVEAGLFDLTFPVIFAALVWGGLFLRDPRLRALIPWRAQLESPTSLCTPANQSQTREEHPNLGQPAHEASHPI